MLDFDMQSLDKNVAVVHGMQRLQCEKMQRC